MIYEIHPKNPQERLLKKICDLLIDGAVIAYPTDTCYGIGCDIRNKSSIERIYQMKQEDQRKPFSFMCENLKHISEYAYVSNYAYRNMKRLLPGPYTFILEGTKLVPRMMLTKRKTVGIRVPNNKICLSLLNLLGHPILTTTATTVDGELLNEPLEIHNYYKGKIDLVIDGGPVSGEPSSVISLINDIPEVIRIGAGDVSIFELALK